MELDMKTIGNRIKLRRKELGLTQTDLRKACGISSGGISEIENGNAIPTIITAYKIAQTLQCSVDWIITGNFQYNETSEIAVTNQKFLDAYNQLSEYDKEELLQLMSFKLQRAKKVRITDVKSSLSADQENDDLVG